MTGGDVSQDRPPSRRRQPIPPLTWLLVGLIILFFVLGLLLVSTGLLTPGGGNVTLPGPTAFTLTP